MQTVSENENLKKSLRSSWKFCLHIYGRRNIGTHVPYLAASQPRCPCLYHLGYQGVAERLDLKKVSCNGVDWTEAIQNCARRTYVGRSSLRYLNFFLGNESR